MRNLWLVAKHEYGKIVRRKSFLIGTLGVPLLIIGVTAVSILLSLGRRDGQPLGYVDQAGVLASAVMPTRANGKPITAMRAFDDEQTARTALNDGKIRALYVLPPDYLASGQARLYYLQEAPPEVVQGDFSRFLRANLLIDLPQDARTRLQSGASITIRAADGSREFDSDNVMHFIVPFVASFFFIFAVMNSGGYMLQAVTDEKENRTIELLATSVRPEILIGGKALGLMSVGITQLLLWVTSAVAGLLVAAPFVEAIPEVSVPWSLLGVVALFFVPAYTFIAGMMTAVGSIATDLRQGQQITGIFNLFFSLPFFFLAFIMSKPNHPLVVILTLFPTTAFGTLTMRWAMTAVPLWQVITSWLLLVASASLSIWAAGRIFRIGMLRYGQRLDFKHIIAALRGQREVH